MAHEVYTAIAKAVRAGRLSEPFPRDDFRNACPGFGHGTYQAFLGKHRVNNPGGKSELFERARRGQFACGRPFRYGL